MQSMNTQRVSWYFFDMATGTGKLYLLAALAHLCEAVEDRVA